MKRIYKLFTVAILSLVLLIPELKGQGDVELTAFGGYMFGGKLRFYEGELKIKDNPDFGGAINFLVARDTRLEVTWSQMNTTASFVPYRGFEELPDGSFDANVGYILAGTIREIPLDNEVVVPYGGAMLGAAYFSPKNIGYNQTWKFAGSLAGGLKLRFSDAVALRLQGRFLFPFFWGGAGFTIGTGGAGISVGASTSMLQGDLTGGLVFSF
ncbi:MAG: hypothetical protein Kow00127_03430 [Bacteroidales bacterium]